MPCQTPILPLRTKLLNLISRPLLAWYPDTDRIEELVHEKARRETGLSDFGNTYYREGLHQLLKSAGKDAGLNLLGWTALQNVIANHLSNRLLLTEAVKRAPEVFQGALKPPLIIFGLP